MVRSRHTPPQASLQQLSLANHSFFVKENLGSDGQWHQLKAIRSFRVDDLQKSASFVIEKDIYRIDHITLTDPGWQHRACCLFSSPVL